MEVEVVVPLPPVDFNFDSTCSSPYMTAPSSPQRFGNFFSSAPTSPTRISSFYRDISSSTSSSVHFQWEEKPGTPKSRNENKNNDDSDYQDYDDGGDFEFNFSGQLDRTSLSADELFDGGKIRPLKPPPGYDSSVSSISSSKSSSPRSRTWQKKDFDPFQAALEQTRRKEIKLQQNQERGRERNTKTSNYVHKGSRSLSPLRVSDLILDQEEEEEEEEENNNKSHKYNAKIAATTTTTNNPNKSFSFLSAISFSSKGYKKWKLKDFLLFRSASEGRASGNNYKDPLKKYAVLSKRDLMAEDIKNTSFRSTDSSIGGSSRRRGPVSAHELHYTANRAVSEELKRKTFLPYKQGLLGCLGFNPGVHEISRGVGSLTRG